MRGRGWEGLAQIKILLPKVLRFLSRRNKRTKEKDKKRDEKIFAYIEPNRTNPNPNRTKRNEPTRRIIGKRNKLDEEDGLPK